MPALSSDAILAQRQATIVTVQDNAIQTKFPSARDGQAQPADGYFDSQADASTSLAVRFSLVGTVRRRFNVGVQDLVIPDLSLGLPCFTLADAEQSVNAIHLVSRGEYDFEDEKSGMELFG